MQEQIMLHELKSTDSVDVYKMLQKIDIQEYSFRNEVNGMTYDEYKTWLKLQEDWARGESLPNGFVRQWTFWLYVDNNPVGYGKLREKLTEKSKIHGGNIGYAISKDERGKGYGTKLFKLLLAKAKELGIETILSTVDKSNPVSRAVQLKCGGKLISENDCCWYYSFDE